MDPRIERLTEREVQLLRYVFQGLTDKEIAEIDGIAPQSVSNGIYRARSKLDGLDRRRAARLVGKAKGWSMQHTPAENTLPIEPVRPSPVAVSHGERLAMQGEATLQREGGVFVQTLIPDGPSGPSERRNPHDMLTRVSMLLVRTALLVAATVALLWVYGRA